MEGAGPLGNEHLLCRALRHAVRQRELQVLGDELLDVRTADIGSLLEFDNLEDLVVAKNGCQLIGAGRGARKMERQVWVVGRVYWGGLTWIDRNLALCLAAIS